MREGDKERKRKSLDISVFQGAFTSIMVGAGHSFMVPYALTIGAGNLAIGFLNSFVGLIGPLTQIKSVRLMEKYSRRKIILYSIFLQAFLWIPIILLGFLFYKDIFLNYLPILLIIFYSLHMGLGAIGTPAWFSLMGDLVPNDKRGKYFAFRNRVVNFVTILSMLFAGFLLDYFKTNGFVLLGFSIIFLVAFVSRLLSGYLIVKHYEPNFKLKKGYYFSFFEFIKHANENNFGRFVLFVGVLFFAVSIASPFFAVYMLNELQFSYLWYTLITLFPVVLSIIVLPFWGRIADKYGNRLVIFISSLSVPFFPLLWLFSTSKIYLLLVPSLVAGLLWGAFNLSAFNFIYDSVKPHHRSACYAYFNVMMGVGIFAGCIFGGIIARYVSLGTLNNFFNLEFTNIFLYIFLISSIFRFLVVLLFLPKIKEVRNTKIPLILMRELKNIYNFEHGITKFNESTFHYLNLGNSSIPNIEKIFKR